MLSDNYPLILSALCVWREARGESLDCQRAVFWVIKNRVAHHQWPSDLVSVILQPRQFSSFNAGDPNSTKFPSLTDPSFLMCCAAVENPGDDPTSGAVYYESFNLATLTTIRQAQTWFAEDKLHIQIGNIRFYGL